MGRSVDYLNRAEKVNYFDWPTITVYDEETDRDIETDELEEASYVIEDIQQYIISQFPDFTTCKSWDGNETQIILEGYGLEIGLSEYCGLASLSVRVDDTFLDYCDSDEDVDEQYKNCRAWLDKNWDEATKFWNKYRKIGTFSNGEAVYEKTK